ncbi:hypothetical protein ACA511_22745 [Actinomadura sp. GTD37]
MSVDHKTSFPRFLFTGIGSAIVSGIVAFGVAWATFRRDYKLREKERARRDVIAFCETVSEVIKFIKYGKFDDALMRAHDSSAAALRLWSLYRDKYPTAMEWVHREAMVIEIMVFQAKKANMRARDEKLFQRTGRAGSVHGYMTRWARDMSRRPPPPMELPATLADLDVKKLQASVLDNPETLYEEVQQYSQSLISEPENNKREE